MHGLISWGRASRYKLNIMNISTPANLIPVKVEIDIILFTKSKHDGSTSNLG